MSLDPQDYHAKLVDTLDYGVQEIYGSDYPWFENPPERPQRAVPPPMPDPAPYFEPPPDVITENIMFANALQAAPSVLYARYKQYGQLGVLAWCSEFSDMIDDLRKLGFSGNMFIQTREQALHTCAEILRQKLDIKMQIIVMYLSSQVDRLRSFLDHDRQWDDYPVPNFPQYPSRR